MKNKNDLNYLKYFRQMLQLENKILAKSEQDILNSLQNKVNEGSTFAEKVKKAKALWDSKGGEANRKGFVIIKNVLKTMCVSVEVCNYCERNEANDIEHIAPKTFFPESTFVWDNYLLACKQCNTEYKLDKCSVLDIHGELHPTKRTEEPIFKTIAFVNPRFENPKDFFWLNLESYQFEILEDLSLANQHKATETLKILELNTRDTLLDSRKAASKYFYLNMKELSEILAAKTIEELQYIVSPDEAIWIDNHLSLAQNQIQLKNHLKQHIQSYAHPSVWDSIKLVASKIDTKWKHIFEQIPEALTW